MKSKQADLCKTFALLLLTLHLSSAIPLSREELEEELEEKHTCWSWLAKEVDPRTVPTLGAARVFALSNQSTHKEPQDVDDMLKKSGQVCEVLGDNKGLQILLDSTLGKQPEHLQSVLLVAPIDYQNDPVIVFKISCNQRVYCLNITFTDASRPAQRLHRRAASHMTSEGGSQDTGEGVPAIVGGVAVTVIGLVLLVSVIALCGGSSTYETTSSTGLDKRAHNEVAENVSVSVSVYVAPTEEPAASKVEVSAHTQNGDISQEPPSKRPSLSPPPSDLAPVATASMEEQTERARTLSARSFDPLPELPKLDLAEKLSLGVDADKKEEDDEEAPYSYARVPKAMDGVPQSDSSEGEDDINSPKREASPSTVIPPYGKVTTSDRNKRSSLDGMIGEYAEVSSEGQRARSVTAPIDPFEVGQVRDNRSFTATHLPLPAIPSILRPQNEEEIGMYDSIPETMARSTPKTTKKTRKESLYETVDELAADEREDMYESVPEELKSDSPVVKTPTPLTPTSPERPLSSPRIPDSPIPPLGDPANKKKKGDKKALEKTVSTSDQADKKRSFSIFTRKKATTVSEGVGKTRKKSEKEVQLSKPHQGDPLPDIPGQLSPTQVPPSPRKPLPLPTTPNEEEDEDMYDRPVLPLDSDMAASSVRTTEEAKLRAKTLPATNRSSGANAFKFNQKLPLPDLPEASGHGLVTVAHTRCLEDETEVTKPYDTIHISPPPPEDDEEPNYDTVRPEMILDASLEVRNEADPGYDKVGTKLEPFDESNAFSDEEKRSDRSTSPEGTSGGITVTAVSSPGFDDSVAGPVPEHDEVGYAQVPEMYRMRKRALSANQSAMQKLRNSSQNKSVDDSGMKRATSPEEMYAIIDKAAKKKNRQKKTTELDVSEREAGITSPVPPPLPPIGDLGDLTEFDEPPLPERSESAGHLMVEVENDSGYSKVLKVQLTAGSDPPYAKVKSKVDHPYAELDIGGGAKPDLMSDSNPSSPVENESSPYDTITETIGEESENVMEIDTADDHMYDTLDPDNPPSLSEVTVEISIPEEQDILQNVYDTLDDTSPPEDTSDYIEGPYEEIDEETRLNLQKLHTSS